MTRTTASYALPFGARMEELANPDEAAKRAAGVVDVFDDAGVFAGRLVWRGELNAWDGRDAAHHIPVRRGTFEAARRLVLERCACATRVEAKQCR